MSSFYFYDIYLQALFGCSFFVTFLLIIWNQTNAVVEYARLIGIKFEEYKNEEMLGISFPDYLLSRYKDNFIVRLICCPICLCTWLSAIVVLCFFHEYSFTWSEFLVSFLSVFYFSMVKYFVFKFLMKD
tara:strand:- start:124 stop:510 length:387 start_codon:yes stop_codon:yes gene_type:complete